MVPLTERSLQSVYNQVRRHLLTQNARASQNGSVSCHYRTKTGLKCAVGCLIPDEDYTPALEGRSVQSAEVRAVLGIPKYSPYTEMLADLQFVHDVKPIEEWDAALQRVARQHDLNPVPAEEPIV
jgi:hypothetical protein